MAVDVDVLRPDVHAWEPGKDETNEKVNTSTGARGRHGPTRRLRARGPDAEDSLSVAIATPLHREERDG